MKRGLSRLVGRFSEVVREVKHANAVMRAPEERVRYSTPDEMEERRRRSRG